MVLYEIVKALIIPVSIWAVRTGPSYYQSIRANYDARRGGITPVPAEVARALNVLFCSAVGFLLATLPYLAPDNIFVQTNGRLQTNPDVLFTRLAAIRPLTANDQILKSQLASKQSRLMYFAFGPEVLTSCSFCTSEDPASYLYYALPSLSYPHIFHIAVLGLVTSQVFSGTLGSRWRTLATIGGVLLAAAELWFTVTYNYKLNTRSAQLKDIDFFFWRKRIYRGLSFAALDATLGWAMYLSSTNRFFVATPTDTERLANVGTAQEIILHKLWATGNIRNAVVRDRELREGVSRYWNIEKQFWEEREVVDSVNSALGRLDMNALTKAADTQADNIVAAARSLEHEVVGKLPA